ncbi:MAG: hypothetical protein TECD_00851 [Hyphomicrobiaceae bacterium hypho_1]
MSLLLRIANAINRITKFFGKLAVVLLLFMIALIFYNVISRYIFSSNNIWMQELEWHLLMPITLIGISVLLMEKGHVRVDVLYGKFPAHIKNLIDFSSMIFGFVLSIFLIKYSQGFVEISWSVYESSPNPSGMPGRYILKSIMPICFVLFGLQCLANSICYFAEFKKNKK